jgi:hypothetical protein
VKQNPKSQIPNPQKTPSTKPQGALVGSQVWNLGFGILLVFGIWDLELTAAPAPSALTPAQNQFFETRVRPVLAENCYRCHSAQSEKVKAGLMLDTRDGLLNGGQSGAAVVPGDADRSLLIKAVRYSDPELQMPPKKKLSDAQIALFQQWVVTFASRRIGSLATAILLTRCGTRRGLR